MVAQPLCYRRLEPAALRRFGGKPGLNRIIRIFVLIFLAILGYGGWPAAATSNGNLETLEYRVSLGIWSEVALVHLRLSQTGPERYRAEFSGAAQGMWRLLSRWLPEGYETDMVLEDGRLKPLVYREEFQYMGHHIRKEYRFDYSRGILELWRGKDYQEPVKSWQIPLKEPIYDLLSLFYNIRLGVLGTQAGGQTLKVALVPTPEPQTMTFRLGAEAYEGRKVMIEVSSKEEVETGPYFVFCNSQWVPQEAWTRVPFFGKLAGHLLNHEALPPGGLADLLPASPKTREKP